MIYYSIFCLTTSIVCMIRVQWPAAKYAFRKEYMGFWITLFVVNNILAPILFLLVIFKHEVFLRSTVEAFIDRHGK